MIGNGQVRKFRQQYSFAHQGHVRILDRYGWLPNTKQGKNVLKTEKYTIDMKSQKQSAVSDGVPFFYFRINFLNKDNKAIAKFMLEPDPFFRLVRLANCLQKKGIAQICSRKMALQKMGRGYWERITVRGNQAVFHPQPDEGLLAACARKFDYTTEPIIVYSEPVRLYTFQQYGKFCKEVYLLRICYVPCHKEGAIKNTPWQIRIEKLEQKRKDKPTIKYNELKLSSKHYIALSTEEFEDAVDKMWSVFGYWWKKLSQNLEFPEDIC